MVAPSNLSKPPQWWQHLRWAKRTFWKAERKAQDKAIKREIGQGKDHS
jgi:hypothetical protein